VDLTLWSNDDAARATEAALAELLGRLGARLCVQPPARPASSAIIDAPPSPSPALARVWIDVIPTRATVMLVDGPWERVLIRHVALPSAFDEVAREEVVHIVHSAIEALKAGRPIGSTLAAPTPAPVPEPEHVFWRGAVRYGLSHDRVAWQHELGLEGGVELDVLGGASLAVGLFGGYRFASSKRGSLVEVTRQHLPVVALVSARVPVAGPLFAWLRGGAGLEIVVLDSGPVAGSEAIPRPPQLALRPLFTVELAVEIDLGPVALHLGGMLAIDPSDVRYVVADGSDAIVVVDPARLRPGAFIAVSVDSRSQP
jgi:hypothetical protein